LTVIHAPKSSAHTQHGYSFANSARNWRISVCCVGDARAGYEAEMVCRSVQVPRPSCSTSGGQSAGGAREEGSGDWEVLVLMLVLVELVEGEWETCFFVRAAQSAKEVQERHLGCRMSVLVVLASGKGWVVRFPVLAQHDALGKFLGRFVASHAVVARLGLVVRFGLLRLPDLVREELVHCP